MANISQIKLPSGVSYPLKAPVIPYGTVNSTSTSTAFTATVDGITELTDGTIVMLHNGVVTSASGFTININGLGAKKVYNNLTNATQDTTIFNIAYTMIFVYSTALDGGNGGWWCYRGYDSNTNTIGYQLRGNSGTRPATDKGYRYRLWLTSADDQGWVPINTSTSTNATTARTLNTRAIDPFGEIVYNSLNDTTNAGDNVGATTTWQQYTLTIGYSYVKTLTAYDPVYLKCTPQTTGGAVMNDIVQKLPTTKDGYIYIYLGIAYSTTAMELRFYHPVYYHDGTGVRAWTGTTIPTKTSDLTNDGDGSSRFATMSDIGQLGGGTITEVKTTAGTHTTIDVTSGAAEFNVPTKTSHLTNDSGFLTSYTETDPVFSASPAAGITSADITNWNNKVSDDKTWNSVTLNKTNVNPSGSDIYIPYLTSTSDTQADLIKGADAATTAYTIPLRNSQGHIVAATPSSEDNSTKVATTAFVNTAIGAITIPSITLNGSSTTSPWFYAPTSAGTNGYVLKSNGSGAPSWTYALLTDEKVTTTQISDDTPYTPILSDGSTTGTRQTDGSNLTYRTVDSDSTAMLTIGSQYAGYLQLYDNQYHTGTLSCTSLSSSRAYLLPDASGTVALTNETLILGGNARETSAFYAGTSSPYTCNLQLKRLNDVNTLNLAIQDDGILKLQSVDVIDGQEDWSSSGIHDLWSANMTKVPEISFEYKSASFKNTATGWQYCNISFTVPSGQSWLASPYAGWSSGTPQGVGIHHQSTLSSGQGPRYNVQATDSVQGGPLWYFEAGTYYMFVKRGTANTTNTNYLYLIKFNKSRV